METGTFDLDQAIKSQVALLENTGSLTGADAAELTAHLYDATEALVKQQLTVHEAFIIATKRLGNTNLLAEEYSKVNTTMTINKIWAYMFIGFNMLFALPCIAFRLLIMTDKWVLHSFIGVVNTVALTALHIALGWSIIYAARQKNDIANYIEKHVEKNAFRIVSWSSIPFIIVILFSLVIPNSAQDAFSLPMSGFDGWPAQLSFYVLLLMFPFTMITVAVSVNKFERFTLKSLFQKPSNLFLILTGLFIELVAASTRVVILADWVTPMVDRIFAAVLFGTVYMTVAFVIAFYNKQNSWRYLITFSALGFILETLVGISAHWAQPYLNVVFMSGLVIGVLAGKFLGDALRVRQVTTVNN